jgi:hypothetical protein
MSTEDSSVKYMGFMKNLLHSISFYSPLILVSSIFLFSVFTSTFYKFCWFILWVFTISCIRYFVYSKNLVENIRVPDICNTFIPLDYSYSTFILTFTMTYLVMPMILISIQYKINAINYFVIGSFIAYIALDLFTKNSLQCIPKIFSIITIGNLIGGLFFGVITVLIMYSTTLKNYLYINEVNSNKEVCSMPSKQKFKCKVYKDGTLIGNI